MDTLYTKQGESSSTTTSTKENEVNQNNPPPVNYNAIPNYLKSGMPANVNYNTDTAGHDISQSIKTLHLPLK